MAIGYIKRSDEELFKLCRQDDVRAYNELFDRYVTILYKQALRYLKNEMDAEEVVMDLLLNIWQKRASLNMGQNIKAYLSRSLQNRIINHLHKNTPGTEPIELIPEYEIDGYQRSADHQLRDNELLSEYKKKLAELTPQRREVFLLSREDSLTYAQIAEKMGLSVKTVESHMTSVLNTLRNNTRELTTLSLLMVSFLIA